MNKRTTEEEAHWLLIDIERQRNLSSVTVGGVSAWRLMRKDAMAFLQGDNADFSPSLSPKKIQRVRALGAACLGAWRMALNSPKRPLFAVSYGHMLTCHHGKLEDIFIDPLLGILPGFHFKVAHATQSSSKALSILPDLTASCIALLGRLFVRTLPKAASTAILVMADTLAALGMGQASARALAESRITDYLRQKAAYTFMLRRTGARLVLLPYSEEFGLSAAAAEAGVPVLEVLHGFITRHDPDFLTHTETSPQGELLPRTAFLVQGIWWQDYYAGSGFYPPSAFLPIGNRYISALRELRRNALLKGRAPGPIQIVLGMPGIGSRAFLAFVAQALQNMQAPYHLHLRLHPRHNFDIAEYTSLLGNIPPQCVSIYADQDAPGTPELLTKADWHISSSSSCHFDALALGVPTAVIPGPEAYIMQPLCGLPGVTFTQRPADLAALLAGQAPEVPTEISHAFCQDFNADSVLSALKTWTDLR